MLNTLRRRCYTLMCRATSAPLVETVQPLQGRNDNIVRYPGCAATQRPWAMEFNRLAVAAYVVAGLRSFALSAILLAMRPMLLASPCLADETILLSGPTMGTTYHVK